MRPRIIKGAVVASSNPIRASLVTNRVDYTINYTPIGYVIKSRKMELK